MKETLLFASGRLPWLGAERFFKLSMLCHPQVWEGESSKDTSIIGYRLDDIAEMKRNKIFSHK